MENTALDKKLCKKTLLSIIYHIKDNLVENSRLCITCVSHKIFIKKTTQKDAILNSYAFGPVTYVRLRNGA